MLPQNMLDYEWDINKKENKLMILNKKLVAKGDFNVHAIFKQKKNETEIKVRQEREEDKVKEKITLPGLRIMGFATNNGRLKFDY